MIDRRRFLAAAAGLAASGVAWPSTASAASRALEVRLQHVMVEPPPILPRSWWADGNDPVGPIEGEDVRFILVHHTAQPGNDYAPDDVPGLLRSIYWFHTGPEKQWPDTAYNFFVDQFGRIIEARAGSVAGPVRGSATGGNQGFSQLCCFLGNHASTPPTVQAQAAMIWLLAWLGDRYDIDLDPSARVRFASRGSNRWAAGTEVETSTIAGHRDMSQTSCPGDACYGLLRSDFAPSSQRMAGDPPTADVATTESTASEPPAESSGADPATSATTSADSTSTASTGSTATASTEPASTVSASTPTAPSEQSSTVPDLASPTTRADAATSTSAVASAGSESAGAAIGDARATEPPADRSATTGLVIAGGVVVASAAALIALRARSAEGTHHDSPPSPD